MTNSADVDQAAAIMRGRLDQMRQLGQMLAKLIGDKWRPAFVARLRELIGHGWGSHEPGEKRKLCTGVDAGSL